MDVTATLGSFASRLKKQLDNKNETEAKRLVESEIKRALLLKGINSIRKALQETTRISLGDRFSFDLDVSDIEGWPKIDLRLADADAPESDTPTFSVKPIQRDETSVVQMSLETGEILARVDVHSENDLEKLALAVKKSIRSFLDIVENYVMNPKSVDKATAIVLSHEEKEEEIDDLGQTLANENLFIEDEAWQNSNVAEVESDVKPLGLTPAWAK